ncbi:MAG: hypothetical protein SOX78_08525 [Treponema sp.]|nr:hypothetical protein [Treponema sp.]
MNMTNENLDLKKMITLYVSAGMYQEYQQQAKKTGRKAAELIRDAMDEFSKNNFHKKQKLGSMDFSNGVKLKAGVIDFLEDDWRNDFLDSGVKL